MAKPVSVRPPSRFVGVHCHTGFSTFDGLGYPDEHVTFVLENGMDAWAVTDHGNANAHAHARKHFEKLQKAGRKYRQLYGVEFYFVPSLKQWRVDAETAKERSRQEREEKQKKALVEDDEEKDTGHVVEDEDDTRKVDTSADEWKRRYHLVVLAKDKVGLENIYRLVRKSYKYGFYRFPRIDFDWLKEHGEGLVVSTACLGGIYSNRVLRGQALGQSDQQIMAELGNLTDRFVDAVGEKNFFLELQFNKLDAQHQVNKFLLGHAKDSGVQLVSTADSHYCRPELWEARELYRRMGWYGKEITTLPKKEELKCELYPKNADQMWQEYLAHRDTYDFYQKHDQDIADSIERSHDIAWEMCQDTWIDTSVKLPHCDAPGRTAFQQLEELAWGGLRDDGKEGIAKYEDRLELELADIKHLGFENYFLVMYRIFNRAKEKTLLGPGRGSGAGSLVNYCLGITQVDPIKYNLLWERFLGRHRVSWPDIDSDMGDRDVMIDAAREEFGEDAVIPVSNFNTLKLKSLIHDIARLYGVDHNEVNEITRNLQEEVMPLVKDEDTEKSVFVLTHTDCMEHVKRYRDFMEKYPDVRKHIEVLFMQNRSVGRHAGGVIIADPKDLEKGMPIISVRGEMQTPWTEGMNWRNLESNGLIKYDFLGLTLLEDVRHCIQRIIGKKAGKKAKSVKFSEVKAFFDKHLNCRYTDPDDQHVFKTSYHANKWAPGLFQFTAAGARRFCEEAAPTSIQDLSAITAIYRPGPLRAHVDQMYVEAKRKADSGEEIQYDHPIIKEVLGKTYGFIAFQEEFMLLAQKLAGFSPAESDQLRKTLVKKSLDTIGKKADERTIAREKFVKGAKELHGIPEAISEDLWEKISFFSVYGFNESHSVSYAIDSYYAAWLYTYYPKEWLATILQSENGSPDGLSKTITEIKRLGYKFSSADVNHSGEVWDFSDDIDAFVPPLSSLKKVGDTAQDEILATRPFKDVSELLFDKRGEWYHSKMNKSAFESLCKVEAFGSLEEMRTGQIKHHRQLYEIIIGHYDTLRKGSKGVSPAQVKKAAKTGTILPDIITELIRETANVPDWTRAEKIEFNSDIKSEVDDDLLFPNGLLEKIMSKNVDPITKLPGGKEAVTWFVAIEVQEKKTKNGKTYHRIKCRDNEHATCWLKVWGELKIPVPPYSVWLCQAKGDDKWGPSTTSWKLRPLTD